MDLPYVPWKLDREWLFTATSHQQQTIFQTPRDRYRRKCTRTLHPCARCAGRGMKMGVVPYSTSAKIKTTKISSEGSTSNFAKFCTRENIPLYGSRTKISISLGVALRAPSGLRHAHFLWGDRSRTIAHSWEPRTDGANHIQRQGLALLRVIASFPAE